MKKSIVISLFLAVAADVLSCGIEPTHNHYLFRTVEKSDWSESINRRTLDNWQAYTGKSEMFWFDADEVRTIAQQKSDALMVSYIDNLQRYLEVVSEVDMDAWDYPTKEQLAQRRQTLLAVQGYAQAKIQSRLRSQHALLYMRCNMLLGMHQTNVKFWETTANKFINSVYRDMMRNIYAGALLKMGRDNEATQIFVEDGDVESLYTYYYKKRSFEAIKAEYLRNPNSPAFPFLLQDFANNAQEAYDAQHGEDWPGKLYVRNISMEENRQMCQLCQQVVNEGKTENPALWHSLRAWLLYLSDTPKQALAVSREATELAGSSRIKDNARVIHLFLAAIEEPMGEAYDNQLAQELTWLDERASEERGSSEFYANHYTRVFDRLVHQVLVDRYRAVGRPEVGIAFLGAYDEQPKVFDMLQKHTLVRNASGDWNGDYYGDFFAHVDTIPVAEVERYFAYTHLQPQSAIDRWLQTRIRHDDTYFHELLGTKYMRIRQWNKAKQHLSQVPVDFVNAMNIVPFMANRDFHVEPWMRKQRISDDLQWSGTSRVEHNQKYEFADEMEALETDLKQLSPQDKARRAYEIAARYAQASYAGDCWYLTRYGKSCCDGPRVNEDNLLLEASALLDKAGQHPDFLWRERALFAKAWLPVDSWLTFEWNDEAVDYVRVLHPESHQYQALMTLSRFENEYANLTSDYVSKCDVLRQFRK